MSRLVDLNTFWVGEALHPIQQLCLLSAINQGHIVRLFCYGPVKGVPAGVEVVAAEEIMPASKMFLHAKTGSPAPFADRFRVKLISLGFGAWIDTDMLFFRPLSTVSENIFAWENQKLVGNAVLKFDQSQTAFRSLIDATNDDYLIPPWLPRTHRLYYTSLRILGVPIHVSKLPYGTTGPDLLTWCIKSNQMLDQVLPREVFYSLPYERRFEVFRGNSDCRSIRDLPENAVAIHLWFQGLVGGLRVAKELRRAIPMVEPGSLLHGLANELGMLSLVQEGQWV